MSTENQSGKGSTRMTEGRVENLKRLRPERAVRQRPMARKGDVEQLLHGLLTAHGIGKMRDSADASRPPFRSAAVRTQARPPVTARVVHRARRGCTLTRHQSNRRPASARPQATSVSAQPILPTRPASASSRSSTATGTSRKSGRAGTVSSSPLPAWCIDGSRVPKRLQTPPTAGMMLEFTARRGMGEAIHMAECSGKPDLPDSFDADVAAKGPHGELRFREYTAEEEQGAQRLRAAVEAYCVRNNVSAEATQAHITRELTNYDNALGRRDVRIQIHDEVCPIQNRREMKHVPGMRIFMGQAVNPNDPDRSDRSTALVPTPPSTPPSTPPGKQRTPTPNPDSPWALDKAKCLASGSKQTAEQRTSPGGNRTRDNGNSTPTAKRPTSAPARVGRTAAAELNPVAGSATHIPAPPPTVDGRSARSVSARASVQQAKRIVGKPVWQQLDKSERVNLAAEMAKWMRSSPAAQTAPPCGPAVGSVSPPVSPVEVQAGRTAAWPQRMRLDRRNKPRAPQPSEGLRLRHTALDEQVAMTCQSLVVSGHGQ